jgi:ribonuclease HI
LAYHRDLNFLKECSVAQKYYVVWAGRKPGIFTDWATCKAQVDQFAGAKYKSFESLSAAEAAFNNHAAATSASTSPSGAANLANPARRAAPSAKSASASPKTHTAAEIAKMDFEVKIFTDGGCDPNPGKAGSGIAVYRDGAVAELWYGLYNPRGTNNTAELNAFHQALIMAQNEIAAGKTVAIFCDSKYAIQCITQWAAGWKKKGWTKAGGEIKNLELIKEMFALHQLIKDKVQVLHVNGHVGVEGNELADRMSILAISSRTSGLMRYEKALDPGVILAMRAG